MKGNTNYQLWACLNQIVTLRYDGQKIMVD
jgi:hypothetical protein